MPIVQVMFKKDSLVRTHTQSCNKAGTKYVRVKRAVLIMMWSLYLSRINEIVEIKKCHLKYSALETFNVSMTVQITLGPQ